MKASAWIAFVYFAIRVHGTGFDSYKHLLPIVAILNLSPQVISMIGIGIGIAIFAGAVNVFGAPEFAFVWRLW